MLGWFNSALSVLIVLVGFVSQSTYAQPLEPWSPYVGARFVEEVKAQTDETVASLQSRCLVQLTASVFQRLASEQYYSPHDELKIVQELLAHTENWQVSGNSIITNRFGITGMTDARGNRFSVSISAQVTLEYAIDYRTGAKTLKAMECTVFVPRSVDEDGFNKGYEYFWFKGGGRSLVVLDSEVSSYLLSQPDFGLFHRISPDPVEPFRAFYGSESDVDDIQGPEVWVDAANGKNIEDLRTDCVKKLIADFIYKKVLSLQSNDRVRYQSDPGNLELVLREIASTYSEIKVRKSNNLLSTLNKYGQYVFHGLRDFKDNEFSGWVYTKMDSFYDDDIRTSKKTLKGVSCSAKIPIHSAGEIVFFELKTKSGVPLIQAYYDVPQEDKASSDGWFKTLP